MLLIAIWCKSVTSPRDALKISCLEGAFPVMYTDNWMSPCFRQTSNANFAPYANPICHPTNKGHTMYKTVLLTHSHLLGLIALEIPCTQFEILIEKICCFITVCIACEENTGLLGIRTICTYTTRLFVLPGKRKRHSGLVICTCTYTYGCACVRLVQVTAKVEDACQTRRLTTLFMDEESDKNIKQGIVGPRSSPWCLAPVQAVDWLYLASVHTQMDRTVFA